jgi:tetratricopeptide (TPR) repeat protein
VIRVGLVALLVCILSPACGSLPSLEEIKRQQDAGLFEESITPLRRMLREEGGNRDPEILFLYGRALSMTGQPTLALWALLRAMEDPEFETRAALETAAGGLRSYNYSLAIDGATRAIESDPENQVGYEIRAMGLIQSRQDYERALEDADRALEIDPQSSAGLVARAVSLLGLERIEEAAEAIEIAGEHFASVDLGLGQDAGKYCAVRGKFALEKGEPERAEEIFLDCLDRYPSHELLVGEMVSLLDEKGDIERSNEILSTALADNPRNRALRIALVRRLDKIGQVEEAAALLEEATEFDQPALAAQSLWDLAGFQLAHGQLDEGLASYARTVELRGDRDPALLFSYGDALVVAGRFDEALALTERMTSEPHRKMIEGRVYFEQGDYLRALEHFEAGLLLWPNNAIVRYMVAISAEELGDFPRAIDAFRYSMRDGAAETDARLRLAQLFFAEENYGQALAVLRHDYEKTPPSFHEALLEVKLMERLGQTQGAVPAHLSRFSSSMEFRTRASLIFIEGALHRAGSAAAAEMILSSASLDFTQPENLPILEQLVIHLLDSDQEEKARAEADKALEASPLLGGLHGIQGLLHARQGNSEASHAAFERALELDPEEVLALEDRARRHVRAGRVDEAVAIFERLVSLRPGEVSPLFEASRVLREEGRDEESDSYLRRLLGESPYHGPAALGLARSLANEGRKEGALVLARRAARFGGGDDARSFLVELAGNRSREPDAESAR